MPAFGCVAISFLKLAVVHSSSKSIYSGVSVAYAGFCEFGAKAGFVSSDGKFEHMAGSCGDAVLCKEQIVREQKSKNGSELSVAI